MVYMKYETVDDLVSAVKEDVLTIDNLKRMYYAAAKTRPERALIYRKAIYVLSLEKLNQQWGENGLVEGG